MKTAKVTFQLNGKTVSAGEEIPAEMLEIAQSHGFVEDRKPEPAKISKRPLKQGDGE